MLLSSEDELISDLIVKYANGFLLKISIATVNSLVKSNKIKPIFNEEKLSKRELEIVRLISKEMTNKEIADTLIISVRTVEGHKERILEKQTQKILLV